MAIELEWLNILMIRIGNKGYVIRADRVWFGHQGIVFIDWEFSLNGGRAPSGTGHPHCRSFSNKIKHITLRKIP